MSPAPRSSGRPKVTRVSRGSRCAAQQQPAVSTRSGEELWHISSHGEENLITGDVLGQLAHKKLVLSDPGEVAALVQLEGEHEAGLQHELQLLAAQPPRHQHTLLSQQGLQLPETRPAPGACKY